MDDRQLSPGLGRVPLRLQAAEHAEITARLRAAGCVFAEDEAALLISAARSRAELDAMTARRADGLPLEQVIGWAEFCGLRITVTPGVFVPRRRSEFLVGQAIARASRPDPVVLDLCCGSGAVGVAVAAGLGRADLHAVDIEPAAVACARGNARQAGGHVYAGDLCDPLPARLRGAVDLMIANAPYVPTAEIGLLPAEARLHEPLVTLDGGADGTAIQRRIAALAPDWLAPAGCLLIETSESQAGLTSAAMTAAGLQPQVVSSEELDATVVIGTRPGRREIRPA
jgi:release factor glutamine methyltransferase